MGLDASLRRQRGGRQEGPRGRQWGSAQASRPGRVCVCTLMHGVMREDACRSPWGSQEYRASEGGWVPRPSLWPSCTPSLPTQATTGRLKGQRVRLGRTGQREGKAESGACSTIMAPKAACDPTIREAQALDTPWMRPPHSIMSIRPLRAPSRREYPTVRGADIDQAPHLMITATQGPAVDAKRPILASRPLLRRAGALLSSPASVVMDKPRVRLLRGATGRERPRRHSTKQ